ncbi:MAG TPA: GGDEF domain-containing protein [Usitatibacter sp.]|nr:GGDEF domain-containing protein [Usitatibacter sp.]
MALLRLLSALLVPLGALLLAHLALPHLRDVPASLAGLKLYAPHIAIGIGLAVSLGFGRSRTFFSLAALALAYAAVRALPGSALYHAATVALPLAFGLAAWGRESALRSARGLQRAAALAIGSAAIVALCNAFPAVIGALLSKTYVARLPEGATGQVALAATAIGLASALGAWLHRREAAALALAAGMIAFALSARAAGSPDTSRLYVATAALVLAIAVLQDIFHMAFRDPLTGLLSRRALDEHLAAIGRRYILAMVDVDHFKRVNDVHGHDTGDQVLKMIARALLRVPGARAYRYGGEEFTLLFSGSDSEDAMERLEALRQDIASHPFRLRSAARKKTGRSGRNRAPAAAGMLKVTVSIGVAESEDGDADAGAVVARADKALYRAKHRGRNAVCR